MAKRPRAVYDPGELDRVRKQLGDLDPEEAKILAKKLGGEVGIERKAKEPQVHRKRSKIETVDLSVRGRASNRHIPTHHRVEIKNEASESITTTKKPRTTTREVLTNPEKISYRERLKMDRYAALEEFEIKSSTQVFYSMLSFFGTPPDYVNPDFIRYRMNDYYDKLAGLVNSTRTLFPRNKVERNELFRKSSIFFYSVLDTIRYWNIERIAKVLSRMQANPRNTRVLDFSELLKDVYKPLYILEKLDNEKHIKGAYKLLYKLLFLENNEAKDMSTEQDQIKTALTSYAFVSKELRFYLYPLLLKTLSNEWIPYEEFFLLKKERLHAFLGISENDCLMPPPPESLVEDIKVEDDKKPEEDANPSGESERSKATQEPGGQQKALRRGLKTLEILFPMAGWLHADSYPDLHPYFKDVFNLGKEYELLSPTDPVLQAAILIRILQELFYGLRYVRFGTIVNANGNSEQADEIVNNIATNWHDFIEGVLGKQYLPRLGEYCRMLDSTPESINSTYAKRIATELNWLKRLYFFPHFKLNTNAPPPIRKQDVTPIFSEVRKLRHILTSVAADIEKVSKQGSFHSNTQCNTIDNPWEPYVFQIPNPLSIRIDALLGTKESKRKTNAALVFYTLAVSTVLDYLLNDQSSWAYGEHTGPFFRSMNGEGLKPQFGADETIDTELLFKNSLKKPNAPE